MASIDIGIDQGFVFAQTFLKHSQQSIGAFPPGFPDLTACSCRPTPIIIHDLSKAKLFYDFELESETHIVGSIRILATKALGHPFVSIQGSWFDKLEMWKQKARDLASEQYPTYHVAWTGLVCFNYPRTGVLLTLEDPKGKTRDCILDLDFPNLGLLEIREAGSVEGQTMYSLLDTLSPEQRDEPSAAFRHYEALERNLVLSGARRLDLSPSHVEFSHAERASAISDRLGAQPEGIGAPIEKLLEVPLLHQEKIDYCVIASMQMILRFYRLDALVTQEQIKTLLLKAPPLYTSGGITAEDQLDAFQRVFPRDQFQVRFEYRPSWESIRHSIDDEAATKSGIYGHSRVVSGYREAAMASTNPEFVLERQRFLWINDPAVPSRRLELFETINVSKDNMQTKETAPPFKTNSVYVTRAA